MPMSAIVGRPLLSRPTSLLQSQISTRSHHRAPLHTSNNQERSTEQRETPRGTTIQFGRPVLYKHAPPSCLLRLSPTLLAAPIMILPCAPCVPMNLLVGFVLLMLFVLHVALHVVLPLIVRLCCCTNHFLSADPFRPQAEKRRGDFNPQCTRAITACDHVAERRSSQLAVSALHIPCMPTARRTNDSRSTTKIPPADQ